MRIEANRLTGAGNSFWFIDLRQYQDSRPTLAEESRPALARAICSEAVYHKKTDGLILLESSAINDFQWDFYNSDGSSAEMCGNAARCVAELEFLKRGLRNLSFGTRAGNIQTNHNSDSIRVLMPPIKALQRRNILGTEGFSVNTGVPHFVVEAEPALELAKILRNAAEFGADGSNITFVRRLDSGRARAVTFERGVEDFTQACGTGAVAAAAWLNCTNPSAEFSKTAICNIEMPGGELSVESAESGRRPWLIGNAIMEDQIFLDIEGETLRKIK